METNKSFIPSEGEEYIGDFFDNIGIKYEAQRKISSLKFDTKQYRIADFYLPKFKVCVEFLGLWNSHGNEEYKIKKQVYKQNNLPCVYLYPDNLATIDYTFDKRIQKELKRFGLIAELRAYYFYKFKKSHKLKDRLAITLLAIGVILYKLITNTQKLDEFVLIGIAILIAAYQTRLIRNIYLDIFKRNKFSLGELY